MLKPGWINRYLPSIAREVASDVATYVGFAWAGLTFVSATLNTYLAVNSVLATWAMVMTIFGIVGKFVLGIAGLWPYASRCGTGFVHVGREALLISTGWQAKSPPLAEK
jgi:intracellular septation protein